MKKEKSKKMNEEEFEELREVMRALCSLTYRQYAMDSINFATPADKEFLGKMSKNSYDKDAKKCLEFSEKYEKKDEMDKC